MRTEILFHFLFFTYFASSCAVLHHAQYGDIDNRHQYKAVPFDLKVSETGVNLEEAGQIGQAVSQTEKTSDLIGDIAAIISLFQMGPHTGNGVFKENYAEGLVNQVMDACPSGHITGLSAIREMRKYPVISGEIVKIRGFCLMSANNDQTTKIKKKLKKKGKK
jgi:hypothetical protein